MHPIPHLHDNGLWVLRAKSDWNGTRQTKISLVINSKLQRVSVINKDREQKRVKTWGKSIIDGVWCKKTSIEMGEKKTL